MKPLKLTMQAFGSYGKKTVIDFSELNQSIFLVTGDTGSGKTTIFDAIVFALYGEASSGNNKKDGIELQSQFVELNVKPFVELEFLETGKPEGELYRVRRIPRHKRKASKKGAPPQSVSESVSLIMPDGSEYPAKQTDAKLLEIVGLTKQQFMQVAMIAQGEFMELLRSDSNKRKEIFRKLFHTELYQYIVNELSSRKKGNDVEKERDLATCKTVTENLVIPSEYVDAQKLKVLKGRVISAKEFSVTDMEDLLETLKNLCSVLEQGKQEAEESEASASRKRDDCHKALSVAQELQKSFDQLENAERELNELALQEERISLDRQIISEINDAYDIKPVYDKWVDANSDLSSTEEKLKEQEISLPKLEECRKEAEKRESQSKDDYEKVHAEYNAISDKVAKALDLFKNIKTAKTKVKKAEENLEVRLKEEEESKSSLERLESQEQLWRTQETELKDSGEALERWNSKQSDFTEMKKEAASLKEGEEAVKKQSSKVSRSQKAYEKVRKERIDKEYDYETKETAFYDAQAGFIASTQLKPGKPCPVCGSLEHPSPCKLSEVDSSLTREALEELKREVETLRDDFQKKSEKASADLAKLNEMQKNLDEDSEKLRVKMEKRDVPGVPEKLFPELAESLLSSWGDEIDAEGVRLKENAQKLSEIRSNLAGVEEQKKDLRDALTQASERTQKAEVALAELRTTLKHYEDNRDYQTKKDADEALKEAKEKNEKAKSRYDTASTEAKKAREEEGSAKTLIKSYKTELPNKKQECLNRRSEYENILAEKALSEEKWKDTAGRYMKDYAGVLQNSINEHVQKKATVEGALKTAKDAVAGKVRPDIVSLESLKTEAEENFLEAKSRLENCRDLYNTNKGVYDKLKPLMECRAEHIKDAARVESLYKRLSGGESGARMDIETFVQRYYLQRMVTDANKNFLRMSAGQYELRIIGEESAGKGKNRGLDLMVYSRVTGKEREIRTLSGGESFMAALSLALGMASRIQMDSSAINLDILFVDEGFGSLDDHSRNESVKVLRQMAVGSKLIGIISHVTELKHEIEDQLIVEKDEEGSHVRWQIS